VSTVGLFAVGTLVTLIVAVGLALPVYGAILDGRYADKQRLAEVRALDEKRGSGRDAA
jgi:hypothetical protein